MNLQAPRGTKDLYGNEIRTWRTLEETLRQTAATFCYHEIRTPVIEHTELFQRGVGDATDIVQKEMYTFQDKSGRSLTLRPELTAGVARAFIEHGMGSSPQPVKLFYIGANFRYENPQAGRYRQHHQFGVELFGAPGPEAEADIISLGRTIIDKLGLSDVALHINSIGCPQCRGSYIRQLREFADNREESLCDTCKQRMDRNVLRVLDCKTEGCREALSGAPSIVDALDGPCGSHFFNVCKMLDQSAITYVVNPSIVRGLDYYNRTVFEFIDGGGLTVIGGGRYDGLIETMGGVPTPGAGFGMGLERLVMNMKPGDTGAAPGPAFFICHIGPEGRHMAQTLTYALRRAGVAAECDLLGRSVKAQMKYGDKIGAAYTMVIGENELASQEANVKNMQTGKQLAVEIGGIDALMALAAGI